MWLLAGKAVGETEEEGDGKEEPKMSPKSPSLAVDDERVIRVIQAGIRGWLLRRKYYRFTKKEVEMELVKLLEMEAGFTSFFAFLLHLVLFLMAGYLRAQPAGANSIQMSLRNYVNSVHYVDAPNGPYQNINDVESLDDVRKWLRAFMRKSYVGLQMEWPCNSCELFESVLIDSCNVTYQGGGPNNSSSQVELCSDYSFCYDGTCDDFDPYSTPNDDVVTTESYGVRYVEEFDCFAPFQAGDPMSDTYISPGVTKLRTDYQLSGGAMELSPTTPDGGGTLAERNKFVSGVMVHFKRLKEIECEDTYAADALYGPCLSVEAEKSPIPIPEEYGYLQRAIDVDQYLYFNEEVQGHAYLVDVGVFDSGFMYNYCIVSQLTSPAFLSESTGGAGVTYVSSNGNNGGFYALTSVAFDVSRGGRITSSIDILVLELGGKIFSKGDAMGAALQLIFFVWLCCYIIKDAVLMHLESMRYRQARSLADRRDRKILGKALSRHLSGPEGMERSKTSRFSDHLCLTPKQRQGFFSPWSLFIRWLSHGLFLTTCGLWVSLSVLSTQFDAVSLTSGFLSMDNLTSVITDTYSNANLVSVYNVMFCIAAVVGLLRLLSHLSFHKRLSMVTSTLTIAFWSLVHFLLLLLMILTVFSFICSITLGYVMDDFSTWGASFTRLLRLAMGEIEDSYQRVLDADSSLGLVIVILFQLLVGILLLNVLISLIIGAYEAASLDLESYETIVQSLHFYFGRKFMKLNGYIRTLVTKIGDQEKPETAAPPAKERGAGEDEGKESEEIHRKWKWNDPTFQVYLADAKIILYESPAPKATVLRILSRMVFYKTFGDEAHARGKNVL